MFMIFSLRRADVLPVGDLGVQKGLLRWILAAHGALPSSKVKANDQTRKKYGLAVDEKGRGELDTRVVTPPPESSAPPQTPQVGALITADAPPTPLTPGNADVAVQVPPKTLPPDFSNNKLLHPPKDVSFDAHHCAPLPEGMSIDMLKARLGGKKAKSVDPCRSS